MYKNIERRYKMQLTETHQIKPNHKLYSICDELCFKSKNLYNAALFEFRQSYFDKELDVLTWQNINRIFNQSNQFDYRELPSKVSNTVLKKLGNNISSFWSLVKKPDYNKKVKLPKYLHKTDGRFIVEFNKQTFSNKRDEDNNLIICKSSLDLRIPTKVENPQQVRIVPKTGCYVIEVIYEVKENKPKQNQRVASIDLGLNNLATVVTNDGDNPILISGKKIKSINQYYNKMTSKQKSLLPNNTFASKSLDRLWLKRNNKISYEIHKITKFLANYFDERDVSKVIIGNNSGWKNGINLGKRNNQNFVNIPYSKFINQLTYKCQLLGITVITREESYTSKASFLDYDEIPNYEDETKPKFSGKRIKRGLYRSAKRIINADVNGAYNIMVKENPNYIIGHREQLGFNPTLIKL
jgi:transposase, IS605 orfB family